MKHVFVAVLLVLLLGGAGCFSTKSTSEDLTSEPIVEVPSVASSQSGVAASGVYKDSVWLARSADGEAWTLDEEVLIEHASVPNMTRFISEAGEFDAGTLMIVYVDATQMATGEGGAERIGRYVSTDNGVTWKDIGLVTFVGAESHVPVDPNLVQLPDGTLRLYYYDFAKQTSFYAADSKDGETFTVVGKVFSGSGRRITDPEVIFYGGKFYLFYAFHDEEEGGIRVAVGDEDGLSFTQKDLSGDPEGIPGVTVVDGKLRLFGCVMNEGVVSYTADESLVFSDPVAVIQLRQGPYCDPDPVQLDDGSFLLVVKKLPDVKP